MTQQFTAEEIARKRAAIRRFLDRGRKPASGHSSPPDCLIHQAAGNVRRIQAERQPGRGCFRSR